MAQIKISQISKDFNMKSKDVADAFKEIGFEKKNSSATVDAEELELFLNHMTRSHQIKDLDAYTSGSVKITVVAEKKPAAPVEAKAGEDKAADVKEQPKTEVKQEEAKAAKAEIKAPQGAQRFERVENKAQPQQSMRYDAPKEQPRRYDAPKEQPKRYDAPQIQQSKRYDAPKDQRPYQQGGNQNRPQQQNQSAEKERIVQSVNNCVQNDMNVYGIGLGIYPVVFRSYFLKLFFHQIRIIYF